ncbi:hypothetical protein CWI80_02775 [Pseudidiomarina sediminum]|uniref:Bacteriophage CI repressor N-terminal domain-containing protein n=1 Tax=Pseudidiomarina sediminum TaxID=431675 RepID=A0A432Z8Q6_9GAMM|nr:helix-turn-helix domain-containing protein [Pseudidiomarina sediminum]MBY6063456.1 helix-turn-helix domain containing protein [Pseudidiomarina sediminum]RUO74286.1 hypothetical protein CWI80_02775 [Pseudidiomarina sediminum]
MSNDDNLNSTHRQSKSNVEMLTMDEVVTRLRRYYGDQSVAALMRKLGIPTSTYGNWRKRGTVTYDHLVQGLIRCGISLDWFFAPDRHLDYPRPSQLYLSESENAAYQGEKQHTEVLTAAAEVRPFMAQYQVPETPENEALLVEVYLAARADHVNVDFALRKLAMVLGKAGKQKETPLN